MMVVFATAADGMRRVPHLDEQRLFGDAWEMYLSLRDHAEHSCCWREECDRTEVLYLCVQQTKKDVSMRAVVDRNCYDLIGIVLRRGRSDFVLHRKLSCKIPNDHAAAAPLHLCNRLGYDHTLESDDDG